MKRYDGHLLSPDPHITVLGSCKVGNFVVTLPLLQILRRRYPKATIDFWGSEVTRDFEVALCSGVEPLLNWRISWDQPGLDTFQQLAAAALERGQPELLINCDGFNPVAKVLASWLRPHWVAGGTLTVNGRNALPWGEHPYQRFLGESDWDSPAFLDRHSARFRSNYIAELLCRMAYLDPRPEELEEIKLPWAQPCFEVPPLLIHCTTTRAAKIWPFIHWRRVMSWCKEHDIKVGLIGAPPSRQAEEYHAGTEEDALVSEFCESRGGTLKDLRGRTSLIELAGACHAAKAMVSVDAGPLHIAAAAQLPSLAIVGNDINGIGASPIRLWMPRSQQVARTVSSASCTRCTDARFSNNECLADRHDCMEGVEPEQVTKWLSEQFTR
jgi:heptosyltransferase-3